jgi:hypothetical protein
MSLETRRHPANWTDIMERMEMMIGQGIYSVSEASAMLSVSHGRIRRWMRGYDYRSTSGNRSLPPVVPGNRFVFDGALQLTFLDLIEIRLINRFLEFGLKWSEIRRASRNGAELLSTTHPFASFKFRTDGRRIFADVGGRTKNGQLVEIANRQTVFRGIVEPTLRDVVFEDGLASSWWPLGRRHRVVVDPKRAFGKPIGATSGVPIVVLANYAERFGRSAAVAWYEVDAAEVRDAVVLHNQWAA